MLVPFPELAVLRLSLGNSAYQPVLPDSFLGGSAPRLRYLVLASIPFPGLPKLLLSTTHLVHLRLFDITFPGYISPEPMVASLSMLTSPETLHLGFKYRESSPDEEIQYPFPPTHSVLPVLKRFWFQGVNEYLEELVARIDAPRLCQLSATFFNDSIEFDTPELVQFISRSPSFKAPYEAHVVFDIHRPWVKLQSQASDFEYSEVQVSCIELLSLARICTSFLPLLSTAENLLIYELKYSQLKVGIKNIECLELLQL